MSSRQNYEKHGKSERRHHANEGISKGDRHHRHEDRSGKEKPRSEETKKRLHSSLSATVNAMSSQRGGATASPSPHNTDEPMNVLETVSRQRAIEQINASGFIPASFKSGRRGGGLGSVAQVDASSVGQQIKQHDKAMFGPMWASKELEKKMGQQRQDVSTAPTGTEPGEATISKKPTGGSKAEAESQVPLAHKNLSEDPTIRQARWIGLFREQRRQLLNGEL